MVAVSLTRLQLFVEIYLLSLIFSSNIQTFSSMFDRMQFNSRKLNNLVIDNQKKNDLIHFFQLIFYYAPFYSRPSIEIIIIDTPLSIISDRTIRMSTRKKSYNYGCIVRVFI